MALSVGRAAAVFTILSMVMTFPLIFRLGTAVRDKGDPILNCWIMSWNIQKISRLDFRDYFDANIFYPNRRTLAYSEILLTQSVLALPVWLVSRNPVLAHNFAFLLGFILSGLGMWALVRHLVKNEFAAYAAGLIFAFSPFMMEHLSHLQVISAGGIPFAFLFLHRFFENARTRDIVGFAVVYVLQFLANGYYGVYLTLFAGLFLFGRAISSRRFRSPGFWGQLALLALIAAAALGPILVQYVRVRNEMGFVRENTPAARLTSFLSAPEVNRLYGSLTASLGGSETRLFPGLLALILAGVAIISKAKRREEKTPGEKNSVWLYTTFALAAAVFSFGATGPYTLLYNYVPGFNGLRVPSRLYVMTIFALAVLAAYGLKRIFPVSARKTAGKALVILVLCTEYASFPLPLEKVREPKSVPEVYRWLSAERGKATAVVEVPLPRPPDTGVASECLRMYYSIFHGLKLVNGFSGYIPPLYAEFCFRWSERPLDRNVADLAALGVSVVIVHDLRLTAAEISKTVEESKSAEAELEFLKAFEDDLVFAVKPKEGAARTQTQAHDLEPLPNDGWTVESNAKPALAFYAIDSSAATRWDSGPQTAGTFLTLCLKRTEVVRGISYKFGKSPLDYPRGYIVEVSADGRKWEVVAREEKTVLPIRAFLNPPTLGLDVLFAPRAVRYIRITNTAADEHYYWSIHEIEVYRP